MTIFYFVRHAATDFLGWKISGRAPEVHINDSGRKQAAQLPSRFGARRIDAVYCSPQTRARETAQPLADCAGKDVVIAGELDELDFGSWTGKTYDELSGLPEWRRFNSARGTTRIPDGELLLEVQARIIAFTERIYQRDAAASIVIVSHGDVIRAALTFFLGMPLEFMPRFEVSPASTSIVTMDAGNPRVLCVNSMTNDTRDKCSRAEW
ncbi:MAG: histidine phosphatase family protein [Candidatus Binatia bacterium]